MELRKCQQCAFVFSKEASYDYSCGAVHAHQNQQELLHTIKMQGLDSLTDEIIKKTHMTSGRVLDYGCGVGMSLLCFQAKGFATFGIEASHVFLQKHEELHIKSAQSFEALGEATKSFDLIIMKDVLEHVNNPVETFNEVITYLKPGGYFYIRVPNVYHYPFHWSIDTKSHVNHFTPKHVFNLFEHHHMRRVDFIHLYDISTKAGKVYNGVFWRLRAIVPLYHQISLLYQKQ